MGIQGLTKLISDEAPDAITEKDFASFTGRKVAIDASMCIYQFMIAVRQQGEGGASQQLVNDAGEVTSHIQGLFNRTIRLLTNGIKPCYVFDGKPPDLKGGELAKRTAKREKAEVDLKAATESGTAEDVEKFSKRLVRVTRENTEDCKTLLRLMGVPVVEAPMEAEAQCAELCKAGEVFAAVTEDMDCLTFGTTVLLRRLMNAASQKLPIMEFHVAKVLEGMELTMPMFIDLCILCGCDYTDHIRGIGPKKAFTLIKKHGSIEEVLKHIDQAKYPPPPDWAADTEGGPLYVRARALFVDHEVTKGADAELKWTPCDEPKLKSFLVEKFGFNPDRVQGGIDRLNKSRGMAAQSRMDSFFKMGVAPSADASKKRKAEAKAKAKGSKGKKAKVVGKGMFSKR
jgi:flap endonuclease-1